MHRFFWTAVILLALIAPSYSITRYIKVGAIFHKGDEDHISAFLKAITDTRQEQLAPAFELIPVIKYIDADTDSFKTGLATCELLEEGVAAIFGPSSIHTRGIVASIAARYDIPHIEYVWRDNERLRANKNPPTFINVFPDSELVSQAISDIVESMQWQNFAVIYENEDGLSRLQKILTKKRSRYLITIRQLGEGPDYRLMLKEIRSLSICNVIIDVSPHKLIYILNQAKKVKLLGDYCRFIITYMDTSKLPIFEIRNGTTANITGLNLRENYVDGINWLNSAILYDAVFLFDRALTALNVRNIDNEKSLIIDPVSLSCEKSNKYHAGPNITNIMRKISKTGKITGVMNFDDNGRRNFIVHIMDFRQPNVTRISYWNTAGVHRVHIEQELESYLYKLVQEKTFKITTKVVAPYVMEVTDNSTRGVLFDNEKRYEGYCVDLIEEIARYLGFKYEFELVKDNRYGSYNAETKTWDGLIGRLLDRDADFAISDLIITSNRDSVVDFSLPFMNLGISILVSKSEHKETNLFYFLFPLSADVWIYMMIAYLAVSIMLFFQARMAPGEWNNPHPCNSDPEKLENNFSLKNSLWLIIASLMRQGSNILPKAPSIRMLATMWWFFTLTMISSYTAFLASLLTINKMETPIKGIEDLARQTKIKYGTERGSVTAEFFGKSDFSTHKIMWATMNEWGQSIFTNSTDEGVERVIKGKGQYAFLMESTALEYRMERNCNLVKIGDLIINKGYGIAMPRNSPYRQLINNAILYLGQRGTLAALKKKWWQEIGGGLCIKDDDDKTVNLAELGMANVGGLFVLLMCGCAATLFTAVCEFFWNIREVAVKEKITRKEALIAELKFAVNIWAKTKPIKIAKSSSSASSIEDGNGRAASIS